MNLSGKVAIVTGASRGLGRHAALTLASQGAAVALVARSDVALAEVAGRRSNRPAGAPAICRRCLRSALRGRHAAAGAGALGPPSILLNAAAIFGPIQRIQESDPAAWVDTLLVDTIAPYLVCRAVVNDMIALGWGRIVNVCPRLPSTRLAASTAPMPPAKWR